MKGNKLQKMFQDLDEAARLAADHPDCLARIDHLRLYLHFLVLREKTFKAGKAKNNQAILDAVKEETLFTSRLTYTNMVHSKAALGKAFYRHFKNFEKILQAVPEVDSWRKIGKKPSQSSHAEVEKHWAEDRTYLQVQ